MQDLGCGEHCQSCNEKFGCDKCDAEIQYMGWNAKIQKHAMNAVKLIQVSVCIVMPKNMHFKQTFILTLKGLQSTSCLNPTNDKYCNICQLGMDLYHPNQFDTNAGNLCQQCQNNNGWDKDVARCSFSGANQPNKVIGCRDGYPDDQQCKPNCDLGTYGFALYNYRATLEDSSCWPCDTSCYECGGPSDSDCKSCKSGFYLDLPNRNVQMGSCIAKTSASIVQDVYVASITSLNTASSDTITGTSSNPFNSIQDAIKYAYELGAPTTDAQINILLMDGLHAMIRYKPTDFYMPQKLDKYSSTTKITIKPATDGQTIIINYKLRDSFHFLVGGSLTMINLQFDAIDSTIDLALDYSNGVYCTQEFQNCCSVDQYGDLKGGQSCTFMKRPQLTINNLISLTSTEECYGAFGTNFFEFEMQNRSMLAQPSTLILQNVIFKNFIYEYNSFIELSSLGGHVILKNVIFDNMNSCGAIIRNKKAQLNKTMTPTDFKTVYEYRSNNYEYTLHAEYLDSISSLTLFNANCTISKDTWNANPCYSIQIEDSSFTNFGKMKDVLTYPSKVDPKFKLKYQGFILDLDEFNGPITFNNNSLQNNLIMYESCKTAWYLDQMTTNPAVDNFTVYGTKTDFQTKSWISIVNHGDWPIYIIKNSIQHNTGVRGVIYLDFGARTSNSPVLIAQNDFKLNGGFIDTTVINIRARGKDSQDVFANAPTNTNLFCVGLHLELNKFEQNYGCTRYSGGPVKFECLNSDTSDTQSNGYTNYQNVTAGSQSAHYNTDFRTFTASPLIKSFYSQSYNLDTKLNKFKSNQYIQNVGTGGRSLITVIGSPRTYFDNETFIGNGDASLESTLKYGESKYLNSSLDYEKTGHSLSYDAASSQIEQMKSLIEIKRAGQAKMTNIYFEYNWLYEVSYIKNRSQLVEIENMYGQLTLDNLTIVNQFGPINNPYGPYDLYGVPLELQSQRDNASIYPLFRITNDTSKIKYIDNFKTSLYMKNIKFQQLNNDDSELFIQYGMDDNSNYQHITDFSMNNAYFEDIDCYSCTRPVLTIQSINTTLCNLTFKNINSQTQLTMHLSEAPFFKFYTRKPYYKSIGAFTKYTEYLTFDNIVVANHFAKEGGRVFEIAQAEVVADNDPTDYQIKIRNSIMSGVYSLGSAPNFNITANQQWLYIFNTSFSNMTAGYQLETGGNFGSVFSIQGMTKILVESVTAIDIYNPSSTFANNYTDGCGRFICLYNAAGNFNLNVTNSNFVGSAIPMYSQKSNDQILKIAAGTISQSSIFDIRQDTFDVDVYVKQSNFINCSIAQMGSTITINTSGIKNIQIDSSLFQANAAIWGGAIYCESCSLNMFNTTFNTNVAKAGGDFMFIDPTTTTLNYQGINSKGSLSLESGGTFHIRELSNKNFQINIFKGTCKNSSFTDTESLQQGGSFYFEVSGNVILAITDTYFENIKAQQNGGMMTIPEIPGANSKVQVTLLRSNINSIYISQGDGGVFYVSNETNQFEITGQQSSITNIKIDGRGGFIFSGAKSSLKASFTGVTFKNISSSQGGLIYSSSASSQATFQASTLIRDVQATNNGGVMNFDNANANVQVTFQASTITGCRSVNGNGGMIYATANSAKYYFQSGAQVQNITAHNGSVIYTDSNSIELTLSMTYLSNFSAIDQTGAFYLNANDQTTLTINQGTTIQNISSPSNGGVFFINGTNLIATINQAYVQNTSTGDYGGFLLTSDKFSTFQLTIQNSQFHYSTAKKNGTFIFVRGQAHPKITFSISTTSFICQQESYFDNWPTNYDEYQSNLDDQENINAGLFQFEESVNGSILSTGNSFKRCYNTYAGSIFNLPQNISLTDTNSFYEGNGGQNGIISLNSSKATINDATVIDSDSKYASFIHMLNNATVQIERLSMKYGKSREKGGAFYIEGNGASSLKILNCKTTLEYFQSVHQGGFIYNENPMLNLSISNCDIYHVKSGSLGGLVYMSSAFSFYIYDSVISNISSNGEGVLIYSIYPGTLMSINQINLQCKYEEDYDINSINFDVSRNQTQIGSVIFIKHTPSLTTKNNIFRNCFTSLRGTIYNLENTTFDDQDSSYTQITALEGGVFYFNNVNSTFSGLTIKRVLAYSGGTFFLQGQTNLTIKSADIDQSESFGDGGFINLIVSDKVCDIRLVADAAKWIIMKNIASRYGNGGIVYADSPLTNITLGGLDVQNSSAYISGGFINMQNALNFTILDSKVFVSTSLQAGSIIYSTSATSYYEIRRNQFDCEGNIPPNITDLLISQSSTAGGSFYLVNSLGSESQANMFQNCYVTDKGGIYYLTETSFVDSDSTYNFNAGIYGGVYYCKSCNLTLKNTVYKNIQSFQGGIIYLEDQSKILLDNVIAMNSSSINGGGLIYAVQNIQSTTAQVEFINGGNLVNLSSQFSGGGFHIDHGGLNFYMKEALTIQNSMALNGNGGLFNILKGRDLIINNSIFTSMSASKNGSMLYSTSTTLNLTLENNQFKGNASAWTSYYGDDLETPTKGGMIYLKDIQANITSNKNQFSNTYIATQGSAFTLLNSTLIDKESTYQYSKSKQGGAIFCDICHVSLTGNTFDHLQAAKGGSIYINQHQGELNLINNTFSFQYASNQGGIIYISGAQTGNTNIINTTILTTESKKQGGAFYIDHTNSKVLIDNMTLTDSKSGEEGGVFYISKQSDMNITKSQFHNFASLIKGSLMYSASSTLNLSMTVNDFKCKLTPYNYATDLQTNMESSDPKMTSAGAFYIDSALYVDSQSNSIQNCYLSEKGGAYSILNTILLDNNTVYAANAALQGGLIYSQSSNLTVLNTVVTNSYSLYGGVFYLYQVNPIFINNSEFTNSNAIKSGGFTYITELNNPIGSYEYLLKFTKITTSTSKLQGGFMYVDSTTLFNINLHQIQIKKSTTVQTGGAIHVQQMSGILNISTETGQRNLISEFEAQQQGSFIYSKGQQNFWVKIENTEIIGKSSYDFKDVKNALLLTTSSYAGAFYIEDSIKGIQAQNNNYRNCFTGQQGGVMTLIKTKLVDQNSQYTENAAITGGVFKCGTCKISIQSSRIENNNAQSGGVFYIDNFAQINISSTTFITNEAEVRGGIFVALQSESGLILDSYIVIENSLQIRRNSANEGGIAFIESEYLTFNLSLVKIQYTDARVVGGLMKIVKAAKINIIDSKISDFNSPIGAGMYSISDTVEMYIARNQIECNQLFDFTTVNEYLDLEKPLSSLESNFYIQKAKQVISENNLIQSCAVASLGGVFSLYQTNFNDTKSKYYFNAGAQGGVFLVSDSNLTMIETKLSQNFGYNGGAMSVLQESYVYMFRCEFTTNTAYQQGGVIFLNTDSYFQAASTIFQYNQAIDASAILILGGSKIFNSTIVGCTFLRNSAISNTISIMNGNLIIKSTTFEYNNATSRSKNIFVGFSKIIIENSRFSSLAEYDELSRVSVEETIGSFIFIIFDVDIAIYTTIFQNGRSSMGGAIYLSGDSILKIYQSQFIDNYSKTFGGAIFASGFKEFFIGSETVFRGNLAIEKGDDIYVTNSEKNFTLEKVNFTNPSAVGSIYAELVSLTFDQVGFVTIMGKNSLYGAALFCMNCRKINITDSYFSKIKSKIGGAIYIQENELNKKKSDKQGKYRIVSTIFENCEAKVTGGAIYFDNPQYVLIQESLFKSNSVMYLSTATNLEISGAGGAIYYTCNEQILNCYLEIAGKTQFLKNSAAKKGGAIYWDIIEPNFKNVYFKDNSAVYYANDTGCFAQQLNIVNVKTYNYLMSRYGLLETEEQDDRARRYLDSNNTNELEVQKPWWERNLQESTLNEKDGKVSNQRSGGAIPTIYLAHVDKYGQIVGSDFTSKVRVFVDTTQITDPDALLYTPTIEGITLFNAKAGLVKASDFNFAGAPGFQYTVAFQSDGIDLSKQSNKQYMQNNNQKTDLNTGIVIALRECAVGESFSASGKCIKCPNGAGFSVAKMTTPGECSSCPSTKAICTGGAGIGPRPGYWRKNNITTTFIKCLYQAACLGMIAPDFLPTGSCSEGYQFTLCADCKIGYSRKNDFECGYCPDPTANVVRLSFILIGMIGVVVFTVRSTLSGAKETNNITSIFIKILLNHFQLILLTASFNFDWPEEVMKVFDTQKPVASVSTQVISFDCFLDTRTSERNVTTIDYEVPPVEGIRVFFMKLVMLGIMPFLLLIVTIAFWLIYRFIKKSKDTSGKMVATMVIVLFLIHPNIVQYMFFNFKCLDISEELRVMNDLEVLCWGEYHTLFSYFVAIPCIIVWGVGIPAFAYFIMRKHSKNLDALDIKEKFGFLYRGYRIDYYFWEIVIMYRKMVLIFVAVFVGNYGVIAQALIVFVILIAFLLMSMKTKPYQSDALNDLEMMSLVTSMISVYCGLFFITNKPEQWIKDNPDYSAGSIALTGDAKLFFLAIIIGANLIFILYWAIKMYAEVKAKFRKMMPKLYLMFCLCFNQRKLDAELKDYEIQLENEQLKEQYLKNLEVLQNIYFSGQILLNSSSLEKLLAYLNPDRIIELAQPISDVSPEKLLKIQKRKERAKINEKQRKQDFGKVHDLKALGLDDTQSVDLDKPIRLGSAKTQQTQSTQRKSISQEKLSDTLQIDEAFIEDDEETKRLREEWMLRKQGSFVLRKQQKKDKDKKQNDSSRSFDSQFVETEQNATELDALDPVQETQYQIHHDSEDEREELASMGFSELDEYEKEQQEAEDLQRIDNMAVIKEKEDKTQNIHFLKKMAKLQPPTKKNLTTMNLFDKIKYLMKQKEPVKQVIHTKQDSINRQIEIEDIDDAGTGHNSFVYTQSNNHQRSESEKARVTHFSNFSSKNNSSSPRKHQQEAMPTPGKNQAFLQTPFIKKIYRKDTIKEALEEEKEYDLELKMTKAAQKRNKYKLGVKTESQMIKQPLTASNIEALISMNNEQVFEPQINSFMLVEQELKVMEENDSDKSSDNKLHEIISNFDELKIEDSFKASESDEQSYTK
ncbi:UNKNOWN [Stylonychia lemnae]|uniref:Uncharacterized protein n=1 Tax=Stylonychia lemnae TaxID=5949 RepID=A0A077ZY07_STYLE|nr:UNKNOWN [Stylonychia lemnae]|eukprot:CDW74791.1 UNKNOWN [Stylonychia lemnae]